MNKVQRINKVWNEIEAFLNTDRGRPGWLNATANPGATDFEIGILKSEFDFELPADFVASWRRHNGCLPDKILFAFRLLPIKDIIAYYHDGIRNNRTKEADLDGEAPFSFDEGGYCKDVIQIGETICFWNLILHLRTGRVYLSQSGTSPSLLGESFVDYLEGIESNLKNEKFEHSFGGNIEGFFLMEEWGIRLR